MGLAATTASFCCRIQTTIARSPHVWQEIVPAALAE
jgi:hypothetical protein